MSLKLCTLQIFIEVGLDAIFMRALNSFHVDGGLHHPNEPFEIFHHVLQYRY